MITFNKALTKYNFIINHPRPELELKVDVESRGCFGAKLPPRAKKKRKKKKKNTLALNVNALVEMFLF